MTQYLLSVFPPADQGDATRDELARIGRDVDALDAKLRESGSWVFAGGLHPADTATTVRVADGEVLMTDGPFVEYKEQLGGFWVITAADLDAALEWGAQAAAACRGSIEVRPFDDGEA